MSITVRDAYLATGSVLAAWKQGIYMAWYDYLNWMGYYTSTALMSVPPSVFGEQFYVVGMFALILSLTAATTFFLDTLLHLLIGIPRRTVFVVSGLTLFLMVHALPSGMPRVETFFWYCSGANYILTGCLGLLWLALMIRLGLTEKARIPLTIATILTGFLLGGGNMMTSLSCVLLSVVSVLWIAVKDRGDKRRDLLIRILPPVVVLLIGFFLCCFAPGNLVREDLVTGFGPLKTIGIAIHYTAEYCINRWTRVEHLLFMALLAPVFWAAAPQAKLSFRKPLLVVILSYGIVSANIAPPLYALGQIEAGRLQALFYLQYILALILTEGYLVGWVRNCLFAGPSPAALDADSPSNRSLTVYRLFLVALFFFLSALAVMGDQEYYTCSEAVRELADGSAFAYRQENEERLQLLRDPATADVVLAEFSRHPALLFYTDIDTDPGDWRNDGMKRYYHKNSVRLAPRDAETGE